jgi:hypothetical protein
MGFIFTDFRTLLLRDSTGVFRKYRALIGRETTSRWKNSILSLKIKSTILTTRIILLFVQASTRDLGRPEVFDRVLARAGNLLFSVEVRSETTPVSN